MIPTDYTQAATVTGNGNIAVQVIGSGNAVTFSTAYDIQLTPFPWGVSDDTSEHQHALDPVSEFIDYVGQQDVQRRVNAWLDSDKLFSVMVITGRGGAGKTRLAIKLCREREATWAAGFMHRTDFEALVENSFNFAARGWEHPTLLVFDYAMAFMGLEEFLKQLSRNPRLHPEKVKNPPAPGEKLRVLLLEREASLEGGWLSAAVPSGQGAGAVRGLFDDERIIDLPPLRTAQERREVMARTLEKLGSGISLPPLGSDPAYDKWLERLGWAGDPLYLMMAAMFSHQHGLEKALQLNRTELAKYIADNELERVRRLANHSEDQAHLLMHLVAFTTLCGGLDAEAVGEVVKQESAALECEGCATPAHIRRQLGKALPGPEDGVRSIQPDLIGEAVVLKALGEGMAKAAEQAVLRAFERKPREVLQGLVRMVQDFGDVDERSVGWLEKVGAKENLTVGELQLLVGAMPMKSQRLARFAAVQAVRLVKHLRAAHDRDNSEENSVRLAGGLNDLGICQGEIGQRDAALAAAQEAAKLYRKLASLNRNAYLPNLALSQNNLSMALSVVGRREDALAAAQGAVNLYRELVSLDRATYLSDLARSLNNLGNGQFEVGQRETALATTQEAVDIRRELATLNRDVYLSDLARSLSNLGVILSEVGQREAGLATAWEAAEFFRELVILNRDAYLPDMASSLNNLCNRLSEVGQCEEGLTAVREAVDIQRELVTLNRDAYLPDLAMSLNNLGNRLSEVGQCEAALAAAREAADIRRVLVTLNRDAYLSNLAMSLGSLGLVSLNAGNIEDALSALHEAAEHFRELSRMLPQAFNSLLARTLIFFAQVAHQSGREDEAQAAFQEATDLLGEDGLKALFQPQD